MPAPQDIQDKIKTTLTENRRGQITGPALQELFLGVSNGLVDAPVPSLTVKANATADAAPSQDVPLATLAALGNPIGEAIADNRRGQIGGLIDAELFRLGPLSDKGVVQAALAFASTQGSRGQIVVLRPKSNGTPWQLSGITLPDDVELRMYGVSVVKPAGSTDVVDFLLGNRSKLRGGSVDHGWAPTNPAVSMYGPWSATDPAGDGSYVALAFAKTGALVEDLTITNIKGIGVGFVNCLSCTARRCSATTTWTSFYADFDNAAFAFAGHLFEDCEARYSWQDNFDIAVNAVTVKGGKYLYGGGYNQTPNFGCSNIYLGKPGSVATPYSYIRILGVESGYATSFNIEGVFGPGCEIDGCNIHDNRLGLFIRDGSYRFKITNNTINNNGSEALRLINPTVWVRSGILIGGTLNGLIRGNVGWDDAGAGGAQQYGVYYLGPIGFSQAVATQTVRLTITDNDFDGCAVDNDNIDPQFYHYKDIRGLVYANNRQASTFDLRDTQINDAMVYRSSGVGVLQTGTYNWLATGSAGMVTDAALKGGAVNINTGTANNDYYGIVTGSELAGVTAAMNPAAIFAVNVLDAGAVHSFWGLLNDSADSPNSGIFIDYDSAAGSNYRARCRLSGNDTTVDLGFGPATLPDLDWKIVVYKGVARFMYRVSIATGNWALAATIATNLPTAALWGGAWCRTRAAAAKRLQIAHFKLAFDAGVRA
jgi:parallel beta-helix repeat protein